MILDYVLVCGRDKDKINNARLRTGSSTNVAIDRWPVFRSLALIFMFQVARTTKATFQLQDLAAMCSWSDSQADEYARGMDYLHTFAVFRTSRAYPLSYSSHGYFLIPLLGKPVGHPGALAIPLTERLGIVAVPKDFDSVQVRSFVSANGGVFASKFSVGTNADRVVVHPGVMVDRDLGELGRQIVQMQKENLRVLSLRKAWPGWHENR